MLEEFIKSKYVRVDLPSPNRRRSSWLLLLALAALAIALVLMARAAAAQTERATEIIERALAAKADKGHGAMLYRDLCAKCHGPQGHGSAAPVTPALAGQLPVYLIKQLVDFAEGDRTEPDMHRVVALQQLTSPQSIGDIATYLTELQANPRPETGDGKNLAAGKRYYAGLCAFCHGARAEGNEQHATPSLQHQHYSYLLAQTRSLAVGHRYSVPVEVIDVLEKVPFDQMTAIADYVSRLPQEASEP